MGSEVMSLLVPQVREKRYIEEKDNHGIQDPIAAEMAWQNHRKRNDSVIVDLFQGQFRSTVMCLRCHQRSVTFEAFMYLSVPIPPGSGGYRVEVRWCVGGGVCGGLQSGGEMVCGVWGYRVEVRWGVGLQSGVWGCRVEVKWCMGL